MILQQYWEYGPIMLVVLPLRGSAWTVLVVALQFMYGPSQKRTLLGGSCRRTVSVRVSKGAWVEED